MQPEKQLDIGAYGDAIKRDGWVLFESVLPQDLLDQLCKDFDRALAHCREMQIKNGIGDVTDGTVHHLVGQGDSFLAFLENLPLKAYIERFFGGSYILNSLGGVVTKKAASSYAANIHRDIRTFSDGEPMMMNMLVMLDSFTLENGATFLMTGSHLVEAKPTDDEFFAKADRLVGPAGSIALWDANLWHAAGENTTSTPRRCITPTFTKPFFKQQADYPRIIGYDKVDSLSEHLRQVLGYNARVPATLDEWYQPPEKRMYKPGQG